MQAPVTPDTLIFVAGARPNFVKIAPILRELRRRRTPYVLVHTGQHYNHELSGVFFEQLAIPAPDVHLEVGSGTHGEQTGRLMIAFEQFLAANARPRGVVVVGDVNSTLACALVAAKLTLPVAHVESGLRSFDRAMPEEINRVVTDSISDLLLVSEPAGLVNLAREGVPAARTIYVGNVMIDTLVEQLAAARETTLGLARESYALVTLHRPANVDDDARLAQLVEFLCTVAAQLPVVFPTHPRTQARLDRLQLGARLVAAGIAARGPLGYREFLGAMDGARIVITDSGGIQEETSFLGVPCVTLRPNTERPVTVERGTNTIVGDDLELALRVVHDKLAGPSRASVSIDGWDGQAAVRIADALLAPWPQ